MSGAAEYPYASGDLLEQRNTYFFTPFRGRAFLDAWRVQRDRVLVDLAARPAEAAAPAQACPTEVLLAAMPSAFVRSDGREDALRTLDRIVQRFEVTKRIHGCYTDAWRPADPGDYRGLGGYVAFAEAVESAFALTRALPYLNALIKCLDTLTAFRARLGGALGGRVAVLIERERRHVDALERRLAAVSRDA